MGYGISNVWPEWVNRLALFLRPPPPKTIFVGAYSSDLDRAKLWIGRLREAGWTIIHDWTIEASQYGNGVSLDDKTRYEYSETYVRALEQASVFWMLAPADGGAGVHTELGMGIMLGRWRKPGPMLITSGAYRRNIFTTHAHKRFESDVDAFSFLAMADWSEG